MRRHNLAALFTLAGLLFLSGATRAQTHTITFDTDAVGNAINEGDIITEQYAAWGAHFVPNVFGGSDAYNYPFANNTILDVTGFDTDYFSPSNPVQGNLLHSLTSSYSENGTANFWIQFDNPALNVSLDTYFDDSVYGTVYGFDADLNLISDVTPSTFGDGSAHLTLPNPMAGAFSYLGFSGLAYGEWQGWDNIQFTTVPEPGSLALLAGIVVPGGLFLLRRRQRAYR